MVISFSFPHFGLLKPGRTVVRRPELRFFFFYISTVDLLASLDRLNVVLIQMLVSVLRVCSVDLELYAETKIGWLLRSIWWSKRMPCVYRACGSWASSADEPCSDTAVTNEAYLFWFIPSIAHYLFNVFMFLIWKREGFCLFLYFQELQHHHAPCMLPWEVFTVVMEIVMNV